MKHLFAALMAACIVGVAGGHEFWIEPGKHVAGLLEKVDVNLFVGENFAGEARPRELARMLRFEAISHASREAILGIEKKAPAGFLRPIVAGDLVLVYESNATRIVLEAAKFDAYLAEEGLESIRRQRRDLGEAEKAGSESYSRCCKSYVRIGEGPSAPFEKPLNLPVELIPLTDPNRARLGESITLRFVAAGKPLADAQLSYFSREAGGKRQTTRTTAAGEATIVLNAKGRWLVSAVHMERADPAQKLDADWQSWWASVTFEVPDDEEAGKPVASKPVSGS